MDEKTKMCLTKSRKTESEKSGSKSKKQKYFRAFHKNISRLSFFSQIEKGVIPLKGIRDEIQKQLGEYVTIKITENYSCKEVRILKPREMKPKLAAIARKSV